MKLISVQIKGYKNLADTRLDFDESCGPFTIIGNNGTGKSNLIEALVHVFVGLYYDQPPQFDFYLKYDAHGKTVEIKKEGEGAPFEATVDGTHLSKTRFKNWIRQPGNNPPFPAQVFTYYSGTCDRVGRIIKKYSRSYVGKLKKQSKGLERQFVFSDITHSQLIMLGLFAHRHFELLNELGITGLGDVRLSLQAPEDYTHDDDPKFWGTQGAIREFLAELDARAWASYQPYSHMDTRVYALNDKSLVEIGAVLEKKGGTFFSMLQALAARKILVETGFCVFRDEDTFFEVSDLSEGEKQLLCVIGGLTLAKNTECLVLLDEPDTHLNPAWSWRYQRLLNNALTSLQQAKSTTIIATHDPILISGQSREQVFIARNKGNELIYERPHRDPRGQGVANILVSEYFGLPSSLDEHTQSLLDERLSLAYKKEALSNDERARLKEINEQLKCLGLHISFRDINYREFEESKYGQSQEDQ